MLAHLPLSFQGYHFESLQIMPRAITKIGGKKSGVRFKSGTLFIILTETQDSKAVHIRSIYGAVVICVAWRPSRKHELSFQLVQTEGTSAVQPLWDAVIHLQLTLNRELVTSLRCS